jgi:hypothetical protein
MQEVEAFLNQYGFKPKSLILDGKIHRFALDEKDKKDSGWLVGFQNVSNSGQMFYVAIAGNLRTGEKFQYSSNGIETDKHDRDKIKKQITEAQKKAEEERRALHEKVAKESRT